MSNIHIKHSPKSLLSSLSLQKYATRIPVSLGLVSTSLLLLLTLGCLINPQWLSDISSNGSNAVYALGESEGSEVDVVGTESIVEDNGSNGSRESVENVVEDDTSSIVSNAITPRTASPNATVSMTITNSAGAEVADGGELTTDATLGVVTYITSNIAINVKDINNFYVTVQAASGASQKLVGGKHNQEINGVGSNIKPTNFPDNTWGSALTPVTTSSTSNIDVTSLSYSTLPTYNTTPIQQSSSIGLGDGTYNLRLVFAAKINADKPADSYGTTTMVSVVATPKELINYSITYNGNGSTSGSVAAQTASSTATSHTFTVAGQGSLVKTGYDFLGWTESASATTAQYPPGVQITLTQANPTKVLYAVWKQAVTPTTPLTDWNQLEYMQQMTSQACNSVSVGTSKILKDSRDAGTSYTIKKLSDNKCWMTDNLRIVNKNISSMDSDLPEGTTFTIPASSRPWSDTDAETNKVHYAENTTYGAYYSWYTATGGTGVRVLTKDSAPGSICPKGWRLPTGGPSGGFQTLCNNGYSGWTVNDNINGRWLGGNSSSVVGVAFFVASGYIYYDLINGIDNSGYYWSSTPYDNNSAFALYFDDYGGNVSSAATYGRHYGNSVRCIAK